MDKLPLDICNKINDYVNDLEELDEKKIMIKTISNEVLEHFYQKKLKNFYKDNGPFSTIVGLCIFCFLIIIHNFPVEKDYESFVLFLLVCFIVLIGLVLPLRDK